MKKIKFKRFHLFNLLLYLLIFVMCLISLSIINATQEISSDIKMNIEDSYRKETRRIIDYFSSRLHSDIKSGQINVWDDIELQHWFDTKLMNLRYGEGKSLKMAINIGYSFKEPDEKTLKEVYNSAGFTPEQAESFQVAFLNLSLNGKPNEEIHNEIQNTIEQEINIKDNLNILKVFTDTLFEKNKVITSNREIDINKLSCLVFKTDRSEAGDDVILQDNNQNLWIEWKSVPLTFLGFEGESSDNGNNINYKKLVIIIGIDEEESFNSFSELFKDINNTELYSKMLLAVTFVTVSVLLTYKFIKIIKEFDKNNQEGDNNEEVI